MARLTDRPDMTLDVYRGRKKTNQQQYRIDSGVPSFRLHVPAALISLNYQRTAWQCGQDNWPGREKKCVHICEQRMLRLVCEPLQSVLMLHFLAACSSFCPYMV